MNSVYKTIGELKVYEICEQYGLSRKDKIILDDVFTRFDEIERFLETEDEERILEAKADIVGDALNGDYHSHALFCAIASICDEFRLIKDTVHQLKEICKEGIRLH